MLVTSSLYGPFSNNSDANIRFSLVSRGEWVSLDAVMQQCRSQALPEDPNHNSLLIQGYIIRVVSNQNGLYRLSGSYQLDPPFLLAYLDLDEDQETKFTREEGYEEALILIDWSDDQKVGKKRFMLMLLKWREDGVAERKGLLGHYGSEYDSENLAKIPKLQTTFILA